MIIESAIERYRFDCHSCGHSWVDDYTVQYVEDSEGSLWSFYRLEGTPVPSPLHTISYARSVTTRACRKIWSAAARFPSRRWTGTSPASR